MPLGIKRPSPVGIMDQLYCPCADLAPNAKQGFVGSPLGGSYSRKFAPYFGGVDNCGLIPRRMLYMGQYQTAGIWGLVSARWCYGHGDYM